MGRGRSSRADHLARARARIDDDLDAHLERIRAYLRQPSVSATGEGIEAGADATASLIEAAGGEASIVRSEGHPEVLGRIDAEGPTLLRYGMYDVQSADEPGWDSPPFEAAVRDLPGVGPSIVARGAANSKGCLAAFLLAVASARAAGELPAAITLLVDGEEELGSIHLPRVIDTHRDYLRADAAFDLDLMADRSGACDVYLGCKGILSFRLRCRGGEWGGPRSSALHSSQGVVIASPAWSLMRALDALVGPDESPRIPGVARVEVPEEDEPFVAALAESLDLDAELAEAGASRFKVTADARRIVEARLYEPAVNLNGVASGHTGGIKTIIPNEAVAAVDIRLPYGSDLAAIQTAVREAVAGAAPEVEIEGFDVCPPARTSPDSVVARSMIRAHAEVGSAARVWPSSPWWAPYHLLERDLALPFAIGGAGHCGGAHAANEYATIEGLRQHMHHCIVFMHRFAQEHESRA
ncbi:MAG: M20/M25/M40 family metallo-hydrolase [Actinomycetota bacterium]